MNQTQHSPLSRLARVAFGALALALSVTIASPGRSEAAGTAANGTIRNVVTVNYNDASGKTPFTASAATVVTVTLVKSALNVSNATPGNITTDAGTAADYQYYNLTSTANGSDGYKVTITFSASSNLSNQTADLYLVKYNGSALARVGGSLGQATGGTGSVTPSVNIGATSMIGWDGTSTLSIPGGALNGIGVNSIVMVGSKGPFLVTAINAGTQATLAAPETYGSLTLASYQGSSLATLSTNDIGATVGERVYIEAVVNATSTSSTAGTITHTITTTDSAGTNPSTTTLTNTTTFNGTQLTITKTAANCGPSAFNGACSGAANTTLTGALPGDVIEYTVTVTNSGSGSATSVSLADAVPVYTTLVHYPATFATGGVVTAATGTSTDVFATGNPGSGAVQLQITGSGSGTTFGKATVSGASTDPTAAGSSLTFWLGASSAVSTGGTLSAGNTYTFKYRVQIK